MTSHWKYLFHFLISANKHNTAELFKSGSNNTAAVIYSYSE